MGAPDLHGLFQIGVDVLSTVVNSITSKILAQTGDAVGQTTDTDNVEWWQSVGFASRPSVAVPGKQAAQAVVIRQGDHDIAIASQDLRGLAAYGNLADGETCVYAPGSDGNSQARALFKDDGSVTLLTTNDNTPGGKVVALTVSPSAFKFTAPWGSLTFDATGFHLKTKAGPRIDMGGISIPGIPDALSGPLTGYCKITAPVVTVAGGITNLGVGPTYGLCLQAPSAAYSTPIPVTTGPTSQCASVRITTP